MIDFSKKILNSNKFRKPALNFLETGFYCSFPKGTTEYYKFWEQEMNYCINGYTAEDGDYITGYNYFYLNYCPIERLVYTVNNNGTVKRERKQDFPDFYDYDYYYFLAIAEAEAQGKHLCVAKARRKGYSYKGGAMLCRNFFLIPNSKSYVFASNKQYLTADGILTKAWNYMDFINRNTAWAKKRQVVNTAMHRRASILVTDDMGNKVEAGYKSEIIGISLKDNPDAVRGKAGKLILWEEAGTFPKLSAAWEIARPSVEQDGVAFGLMIMFGTGGDQGEAVASLREAFYEPESYNCIGFDNIWETGMSSKKCGFFVPQHTNLDLRDDHGDRLYMDKDGNTLHEKAKEFILSLREEELKNAKSSTQVDRYVAEHSETPAEAFAELSGNIFPKKELNSQLAKIRTNTKLANCKQIGDLNFDAEGKLIWSIKKQGDITSYPLSKNSDPTGSIVIWEHPMQDAPLGLYIAGCLLPGEQVLTDKGLVSVEEVGFQHKLVNKDGNFVKISNLQRYKKVNEPTYKIKPYGTCRTTTFTGEHPILLSDNKFYKTSQLKVGDELIIPNRYINITNDYVEYLSTLTTELGIDPDNKKLWEYFGKWVIDEPISFTLGNAKLINTFTTKYFGKLGEKKQIPEWIKHTTTANKQVFIEAITRQKINTNAFYDITIVNYNLPCIEAIQDILYSLGICSEIDSSGRKRIKYTLKITKDTALSRVSEDNKFIYLKIQSIEKSIYTGIVYNFECDTHTYMCRNIVTHNCDPYDHDQSGTNSLGSCFIYKRFQNFESNSDIIVAEYTGRPKTAEIFYENVRKLLLYYNARLLYENQNKGLFTYFINKHSDYLLADQPTILTDIVGDTKVNRRKGCHVSKEIKLWGEGKIKEWLETKLDNNTLRLNTILSEPLLEELIKYNDRGNFDRVMAFMQIMIYREQLYNTQVKQKNEVEKNMRLFNQPLFSQHNDAYEYDNTYREINIPTFIITNS